MNISEKIREERERLGYDQASFAALGGASRHSQIGWEKGKSFPNAAVLAAWATAGADVNYILTGKRIEKTQAERLNEKMVQLFEGLDAEQQREILGAVQEKKRLNQCLSELDELKRKRG